MFRIPFFFLLRYSPDGCGSVMHTNTMHKDCSVIRCWQISLLAFIFSCSSLFRVEKPTEPDDPSTSHNHKSLGVSPAETIWSFLRQSEWLGRRGHRWAISQYVSGLMDTHSKHDTFDAQSSITSIQKCSCWPAMEITRTGPRILNCLSRLSRPSTCVHWPRRRLASRRPPVNQQHIQHITTTTK